MKKLTILFSMLLICCVVLASNEPSMDFSANSETMLSPATELTGVSAQQKLYDEMVGIKPSTKKPHATLESLVEDNMTPTMNDMRKLQSMQAEARQSAAEMKYGAYTPLRELEITTVPLVAFGLIAKGSKQNFRAARNNFIPSYKNTLDNYLQFAPFAASTVMNIAGYQGRSKTVRYLASSAMSFGFMALFVNGIKYTAKEMRPDGSQANSFPSGHTATAFTAATILHKEYGLTRSPWWSILGYGAATTTGIMRTLNNRHWISDVLVGAGIGVISTDLGYMMGDFIFKKKGINRNPRKNPSDLLANPSFFRLELGMQFNSNLKMPTSCTFLTKANLYDGPYSGYLQDDYYTIQRNGNPFRIPDSYDADKKTYTNYATENPAYGEGTVPVIKVATGTTVGAEAAYFINKYIGVGARARITTAPVTAEGLYAYSSNMQRVDNSASVSDVWSMVDLNGGIYLSWPISSKHNVGMKVLYGRRFFGELKLMGAYDEIYENINTHETDNVTIYGDNLYISKSNAEDLALGLHYTYAMNAGIAITGFIDYDYSKPEFDVQYAPYNYDMEKMLRTRADFTFNHKISSFTIGASMTMLF